MKRLLVFGACAALLMATACSQEGSAEKTGENLDSAIEEATKGQKDLGDGPLEKAGESIDNAAGKSNNDAADAINDATDGNPKTKP
jgi:hypothetical protein